MANGIEFRNLQQTISAFQKAPKVIQRHIILGMRDSLDEIQDYARHNHPGFTSRSGNAERSVTVEPPQSTGTNVTGAVYLDEGVAKHAIYQHEGTGLHGPNARYIEIYPRNWSVLRWPNATGSSYIYAKKVLRNPGVKGDPFLCNAAESRAAKVNEIFNRRVGIGIQESGL
jgi:hypothetical protein